MLKEIANNLMAEILYYLKNNIVLLVNLLYLFLPYAMYFFGRQNDLNIFIILFLPVVAILVIYAAQSCATIMGKGKLPPVPVNRFTEVDEYGEVSVEIERTQELILYMADLEDWFERKGIK